MKFTYFLIMALTGAAAFQCQADFSASSGNILQAQGCSTCSATKQNDFRGASIHISMGSTEFGLPAGNLQFNITSPEAKYFTPAGLEYDCPAGSAISVVTNADGSLRQINAPQALADIPVSTNGNGYVINFYYPSQVTGMTSNLWQFGSSTPYVVWKITNCNPPSINQIQISENAGSTVLKEWTYTYNSTAHGWTMQTLGGLQKNTTETSVSNNISQTFETLQYSNGPVAQQSSRTYQSFSWGMAPIQIVEGTNGASKVTTYTYYDPASFTNGSVQPVRTITNPDGSWKWYSGYDTNGNPTNVFSAFGDVSLSYGTNHSGGGVMQTIYVYDPTIAGVSSSGDNGSVNPTIARLTVQKLQGVEVSRSFTVFPSVYSKLDIQCTVTGAAWNASGNLITTNNYYSSGANQYRLQSVINPDQTMTAYNYITNGSYQTNILVKGQPNSTFSYIVDGVSNVTVLNTGGNIVFGTSFDVLTGIALSSDSYANYDAFGRPQQVTHMNGTTENVSYMCCGIDSATDPDGVVTQYLYDHDARLIGYQKNYGGTPISYTNLLDAANRVLQAARVGSDNSKIITSQSQYDIAGRLIRQTNALGGVSSFTETNDGTTGGLITTVVNPDQGASTNFYFLDGSSKKTVGTSVHGVRYERGILNNGRQYSAEIKLDTNGTDTSEAVTNVTDATGRTIQSVYSDGQMNQWFYNSFGQLWKQQDPDNVTTFYIYNGKGEVAFTITPMNSSDQGISDYAALLSGFSSLQSGGSRITQTTNDVVSAHSTWVKRNRTFVWDTLNANSSQLTSMTEVATNGQNSWTTQYRDASTGVENQQQTTYGSTRTVKATAPDGSYTASVYTYGRLAAVTNCDSTSAQIGKTTYTYDPHGRIYQMVDARNGATTYSYNNADLASSVATPNTGNGGAAETTVSYYNVMLQATNVLQADGTSVMNEYFATAELKKTYGSRAYPVAYTYDYAGRMKTMQTWQNFAANSGIAATTWTYDGYRGLLTNKTYDNENAGPGYTYTSGGRLKTRVWARGITTTYNYDYAGGLTNVAYSDTTSSVTNTYDRLGRVIQVGTSNQVCQYQYNLAGELLMETNTAGFMAGLAVTNGYDAYMRRTDLTALGSGVLSHTAYGYTNDSRLWTVSDGTNNATYSYVAYSPLVSQITFKSNSVTAMTITKQYDLLNRLTQISNAPSASAAVVFNYAYNSANQRTKDTLIDGSYWVYQYDSLGQVTSGKKYWRDGTPVAGQQFEYAFDDIGNRTSTKSGGDETGANLRTANYTNNSLNELTGRDVPSYVDIMGIGLATNTVTVNTQPTYRKGEYFRKELNVDNTAGAVWASITNASPGQTTITGNKYLPKTAEVFYYDKDGNLTNDGRWIYTWDGENRLTKMTVNTNVGPQYQLLFTYDSKGRRIQKYVSTNSVAIYTNRFLYDGWNLIDVLTPNSQIQSSYMWGSDLNGTLQGAGGVGGATGH